MIYTSSIYHLISDSVVNIDDVQAKLVTTSGSGVGVAANQNDTNTFKPKEEEEPPGLFFVPFIISKNTLG